MRSAFHRAFGRRNFAKYNEVCGDISWPVRPPICLLLISLYGQFEKKSVCGTFGRITHSQTKNF